MVAHASAELKILGSIIEFEQIFMQIFVSEFGYLLFI